MTTTTTGLTRNLDEAMLGGVLAGIAARYDWDPSLLRIVAALVTIATGIVPGVLIYIVAWVVMPRSDATPTAVAPGAATEDTPTADAAAPATPAPPPLSEEMTAALRDAADRLGEAATIAADAARKAANEIGEVARRPRSPAAESPATSAESPETSAPAAVADDVAAAPAPTDDAATNREPDGGDPSEDKPPAGPA